LVKATAGISTLLLEGIGDTIRYSLTADPVEEARAGRQLLEALGLRERKNVDLIACPSCGRAEVDVIDVANRAMKAFGDREIPLQVAVMGCVVNGPGEAREADIGIAAGNKRGHLFVKGRNVAVVAESEMVEALVEWAEYIHEHGAEAAIARVDTALAEREAAKDRAQLLDDKGNDANHAHDKIIEIRKRVEHERLARSADADAVHGGGTNKVHEFSIERNGALTAVELNGLAAGAQQQLGALRRERDAAIDLVHRETKFGGWHWVTQTPISDCLGNRYGVVQRRCVEHTQHLASIDELGCEAAAHHVV
jgi:hypothetical protein